MSDPAWAERVGQKPCHRPGCRTWLELPFDSLVRAIHPGSVEAGCRWPSRPFFPTGWSSEPEELGLPLAAAPEQPPEALALLRASRSVVELVKPAWAPEPGAPGAALSGVAASSAARLPVARPSARAAARSASRRSASAEAEGVCARAGRRASIARPATQPRQPATGTRRGASNPRRYGAGRRR